MLVLLNKRVVGGSGDSLSLFISLFLFAKKHERIPFSSLIKASEYRGEQAEMNIQRLNVRIDQTEEDLLAEKMKIKKSSDELNQVFDDMINMKC